MSLGVGGRAKIIDNDEKRNWRNHYTGQSGAQGADGLN